MDAKLMLWSPSFLARNKLLSFIFLLALPLTVIVAFQLLPSRYQLHEGEPAPQTIKSPDRFTYVSQIGTKRERDEAAARVGPVYGVYDSNVAKQQVDKATIALQRVSAVRDGAGLSFVQKQEMIRGLSDLKLSPQISDLALSLPPLSWQKVVTETVRAVGDTLRLRVNPEQAATAKGRITERMILSLSGDEALLATELAASFIKPNLEEDKAETEKQRREAREAVPQVLVTLEKGEVILRDGDIITAGDLEKLEAAGLLNPETKWPEFLGVFLFVFTLSLSLTLYILAFQPRLQSNDRRLLLLVVVVVGAVLAAKLTVPGRELYGYLFPLAAAPMLIATLLDVQLAIAVTTVLSLLFGYVVGGSFEIVTMSMVGGLVGLLGAWKARGVTSFFLAGAGVAVANFCVIFAFYLINQSYEPSKLPLYAAISVINGSLAAALTVGTFTILGHIFGITTSLQLMELAHPSSPLLRRLMIEASGTYHHSVIVGNLAERAAEAIGADSLLVRVGSYYHDIGKVLRPGYFAENQMDGENVHEKLDPLSSARYVSGHVTDGLALAKQGRLPVKVASFIAEHHGTRLVSFFYQKACAQQEGGVGIADYCYPGPRPQSKETAIVMLADSVEAIVRSRRSHSLEEIEQAVDKIVADRVAEGQLNESDLSLRDLEAIRVAFKTVLQGVYHPRIEYPEPESQALVGMRGMLTKRR